jgi:hypothetical protein
MPQRKRKKQEGPSLQAATGIAAVAGGTGLFAAAVALQQLPVRVPVPQTDLPAVALPVRVPVSQTDLNDTDQAPAPCSGRDVCRVDNMKKKAASDEYLDTFIRNVVDISIRKTRVVFTPAGREHTHKMMRVHFMQPENEWMVERSDEDYSHLEKYINQRVKLFAVTKGIFDLKK